MAEKRFIPFLQAVREGVIEEGEQVNISACLPKTEGVVTLTPDETGWEKIQIFDRNRETLLVWTYFKDSNGIASLVSSPTNFKLYLKGMEGYANGPAVLQKICWTFANPKIGMSARSKCYEDAGKMFDVNRWWSWKASPYVGANGDFAYFGLRFERNGIVDRCNLYYSDGDANCGSRAVRPVVSILTSDILIDLELKKKDRMWKLVPPKKEV